MQKVILFSLVLCLYLQGCSVLEEPDELSIVNISADYVVELSQSLQLGPNLLMINVQSTETKNCQNSYIDLSTNVTGDQIQLILGEVIHSNPCDQIDGFIEAESFFEVSPRQYSINISLKNVVQNHGVINVSLDRYQLNLESENGIYIKDPMIKIIPDGYVWGKINLDEIGPQSTLETVVLEAHQKNSLHNLEDGNYSHFIIKDGEIQLPQEDITDTLTKSFIVKQEESFEEITKRFETFSLQYKSTIQLLSSTGDTYSN